MRRRSWLTAIGGAALAACDRDGRGKPGRVVFKHQPLWGDAEPFHRLLDAYRASHPGIELVTEALPNASDVAHQFFLTALEGGASEFDVLVLDVVWVAEFARAGWIADLSEAIPPAEVRAEFLEGAASSVLVDDRTWAVPWYVDVGLLYRRTDLVPAAPASYDALVEAALEHAGRRSDLEGYVWQGRQYEGLVCNAYEAIWGHGGSTFSDGRLALETPEAKRALEHLRSLVARRVSPRSVTSMAEEEARRAFQDGRAVFMRNWPYALKEAEKPGSLVRGKVGVSPLPTVSGAPGNGALGGYQLALNAHAPKENRAASIELLRHLTSREASVVLAASYGRNPARRDAYDDERVAAAAPEMIALRPILELAKPRPVTPYYPMLTDILQGEISAAVTGIRSPDEALARAQASVDHLMGRR